MDRIVLQKNTNPQFKPGGRMLLVQFATHGMRHKERRAFEQRWRKAKSRGLPSNAAIHRYLS